MQNKSLVAVFLLAILTLILSSCAAKQEDKMEEKVMEDPEPEVMVEPEPEPEPEPMSEKPMVEPEPELSEREVLLQTNTFYFDYDSSEIQFGSDDALDVHAEEIINKLGTSPNAVIVVEGHADDRGTIEYNNALGNRRAEAVANYLELKGVPRENIETISYGELRPVVEGENETSWALNRRAVIDY